MASLMQRRLSDNSSFEEIKSVEFWLILPIRHTLFQQFHVPLPEICNNLGASVRLVWRVARQHGEMEKWGFTFPQEKHRIGMIILTWFAVEYGNMGSQ